MPTACTLAAPAENKPNVVQQRGGAGQKSWDEGGAEGTRAGPAVLHRDHHHTRARYSCRLLPALPLPACLARPRPHVSTNERAGACCTAQRRATPRAANPMGLREERPPLFASVCVRVCVCLIKRRDAIGFRVRLQIAEALSSSRFSWHAAQDGSGLGGEAVTGGWGDTNGRFGVVVQRVRPLGRPKTSQVSFVPVELEVTCLSYFSVLLVHRR